MAAFEEIYDYVEKDTFKRYFRLAIFIFAYLIFRKYYSQWAGKRQTEHQLRIDAEEKAKKAEREAEAQREIDEKLNKEAQEFGWGKKTRKNVKVTEMVLEQIALETRQRHQSAFDAQEDADIEDLLED
ncbi:hypothetical protein LELG_00102 [Lodderomyces elongisporus NRRL YB-4239]|uniref:Processing of GAS1 and ALP protein 2 n=1 Tax=Lodderomyces elongisporus (strain ATCC 11503 / CBS 2605 / JCM 1781 / NBRC 1676 / NRRL YB-4239) TaxID=379508 RepID=A5DRW6_LODEL|nr:hypothetical protein LELG_00102 [Lodderomyces elongisporus NRRL YB-4239]